MPRRDYRDCGAGAGSPATPPASRSPRGARVPLWAGAVGLRARPGGGGPGPLAAQGASVRGRGEGAGLGRGQRPARRCAHLGVGSPPGSFGAGARTSRARLLSCNPPSPPTSIPSSPTPGPDARRPRPPETLQSSRNRLAGWWPLLALGSSGGSPPPNASPGLTGAALARRAPAWGMGSGRQLPFLPHTPFPGLVGPVGTF